MTTVAVAWTDFANGKPEPSPDPTQLVGFSWQLPWDSAAGVPYSVEVTLDNIRFLTP